MQRSFYLKVISNPDSPHRYWSIIDEAKRDDKEAIARSKALLCEKPTGLLGFGGITNIQWENRIGEISLIINPTLRNQGLGEKAVDLLLDKAFNYLNLQTVCGEVYACNPAKDFWGKMREKYNAKGLLLPNRKYWKGEYHDSAYFSFGKDVYDCLMLGKQC